MPESRAHLKLRGGSRSITQPPRPLHQYADALREIDRAIVQYPLDVPPRLMVHLPVAREILAVTVNAIEKMKGHIP